MTNDKAANIMSRFLMPLSKVFLRAWSVYPLLVPFYLMGKTPIPGTEKVEGGVPQLADYYLVGVMVLVFRVLPFRLRRSAVPVVRALVGFVFYTALINLPSATRLGISSRRQASLYH